MKKKWFRPGIIMLVIGAWGISYVRISIPLGFIAPGVYIGLPFLVAGAFFVTRGLGKRPPRPKWFWPGVILLCLGLLLLLQITVVNPALKHLEQGDIYADQGQWDEAIIEYTKAIELDPQLALAYNNRACTYNEKGEFDRAIADCDRAIELDPQLAEAYGNRAFAYMVKGEIDRAIADCDRAIELDPQLAGAYVNRAWAYNEKGDFDRAIADCDRAIELDPGLAPAYLMRGASYAVKGEVAKAVSDLERCIEISIDPEIVEMAQQLLKELGK